MKVIILLFVFIAYLVLFFYFERGSGITNQISFILLIKWLFVVFVSWIFRYIRWFFLLNSLGQDSPFFRGFTFYLSGFMFTASPGKMGELSRILPYKKVGVKTSAVISCFLYERTIDVLIVLVLSALILIENKDFYWAAIMFIVLIISLFIIINLDGLWSLLKVSYTNETENSWFIRSLLQINLIRTQIKCLMSLNRLIISFILGAISWSLICLVFVDMCQLFFDLKRGTTFGIYPLAMLTGAISFIPGGIGATEAVIVTLLTRENVSFGESSSVAIFIRMCTLWFAIVVGSFCYWLSIFFTRKKM